MNTTTNSLIDDWMSNIKTHNKNGNVTITNNLPLQEVKYGLGYSNNKKVANIISNSSAKVNLISSAQSSGKQAKKRKSLDINETERNFDKIHGLVDDNLGVSSRTDISSSTSKRKAPIVTPKSELTEIRNSKADSVKLDSTQLSDPISSEGKPTAESSSSGSGSEGMKKKRTKTRSKQKNIRKDRRADHVKPPHLQIGSALYAGRPMTEATKIVLNVPLKAKESQQKKERRSHSETKTNQSQKNFTNRKLSATTLDGPPG